MKKLIIISIFISSLHVFSQNTDYQKIIDKFEEQLANDVNVDGVGSISASIIINNKQVWAKAFGFADPINKQYADTTTIYRVGSVSKTLTVFLMMQMIETGYFKLDDPVEKFVPEIKQIKGYQDSYNITFKQLASHTAGLEKEPKLKNAAIGPIDEWENKLLASIPTTSLISMPGIKYYYSNMGISIIGLAISRATNQPFIDLIFENILYPLDMKNSFFNVPETEMSRYSIGINGNELNKRNLRIPNSQRGGRGYKLAAGGLLTTPNDIAKFMLTLMSKSEKINISDKSLELMQTPVIHIDTNLFYGLGLFINKTDENITIIGHGGRARGYRALYCFDPLNKNGVVLMRNYNNGKTDFDLMAIKLLSQLAHRE